MVQLRSLRFAVATAISFIHFAYGIPATVVTNPELLHSSYDFIVVGGGTSGLVVASRLSENPKYSILVVEAGPLLDGKQEFDEVLTQPVPALFGLRNSLGLRNAPHLWTNLTTGPIESLNNRTIGLHVGRIVGGGSALNGRIWMRGSARDYDDWATFLSDKTWSWRNTLPYFKKAEHVHIPPADVLAKIPGLKFSRSRGYHGPINVTQPNYVFKSTKELIAGEKALGIKQIPDQGVGNQLGGFWFQSAQSPTTHERSFVKNGHFEGTGARARPNLHLIANRTVTRVIFDGKRAVGIEFAEFVDSKRITAKARKEVILAAGAIKGPQLLQISGIGPKSLLKSLGIPVVADLPVGENLQDHGTLLLNFTTTMPEEEVWRDTRNMTFIQQQYEQYLENRTGIYTAYSNSRAVLLPLSFICPLEYRKILRDYSSNDQNVYLASNSSKAFAKAYSRAIELTYKSFLRNDAAAIEIYNSNKMMIPIRPASRGYVYTRGTSTFEDPTVNHRTLTHPLDIQILLGGIRLIRKFFSMPQLAPWNPIEGAPHAGIADDDDEGLTAMIRERMSSGTAHMCCTAPMGIVLDSKMRVKGIKGLRVVDASSWPILPGAHTTYCTAVTVAEKAVDLIKEDH